MAAILHGNFMAKWPFHLSRAYFLFYPTFAAIHQENAEHKTYFASENLCNIQLLQYIVIVTKINPHIVSTGTI